MPPPESAAAAEALLLGLLRVVVGAGRAAPAAALVEVTSTLSPAFRPLVISVTESPATPACTRAVLRRTARRP